MAINRGSNSATAYLKSTAAQSVYRGSQSGGGSGSTLAISGTPGPAIAGTPYSFIPTVTGGSGTKSFSLTGSLPAGLSLNSSTGAITGTPTTAGTTSGIGITVTDASGTASLSGLSIAVAAGSGSFTPLPAISNTLLALYSPYKMVAAYNGPAAQACASNAPDTPTTLVDIPFDASENPDFTAATAAFGSTFDIYKWYAQVGSGIDAVCTVATNRFKVNPLNMWNGLQPFHSGALGSYAIIPDALATSRQNVSIVSVTANRASRDSNTIFGLNNTGALATYLNMLHDGGGIEALGNAFLRGRLARIVPSVKAICCGTTSTKIHRGDDIDVLGALTASTGMAGGAIGGARNSATGVVAGYVSSHEDHYFHAVYSGQVSDADMATLKTYLNSRFSAPSAGNWQIICNGDSIMWGQGSTSGVGYPSRVRQYLTAGTVDISNPSTPGKTLNTINTQFNSIGKLKVETGKAKRFVLTNALTNDIAGGATYATCQTLIQTFASQVIAAGSVPILMTVAPRGDWAAGFETIRGQVNAWLLDPTNQSTYGFKVVDRASNPALVPTDTTIYNSDKLHFTDAGYASMAAYEGSALNAIMAAA